MNINSSFTNIFTDNGKDIYITGTNGKLIKSLDSGNTFVKINSQTNETINSIIVNQNGIGFYSTKNEIFKTSNFGDSWNLFYKSNENLKILKFDNISKRYYISENRSILTFTPQNIDIEYLFQDNDIINDYILQGNELSIISNNGYFYYSNGNLKIENHFSKYKNKYLTSLGKINNNILINIIDTLDNNKINYFSVKSNNGGLDFDSLSTNNSQIFSIQSLNNKFYYILNSKIFISDSLFNIISVNEITNNQYFKFLNSQYPIMEICPNADNVYFCSQANFFGSINSNPKIKRFLNSVNFQSKKEIIDYIYFNDKYYIFGSKSMIHSTNDNFNSYEWVFPIDTISKNQNESIWYKYFDDLATINTAFLFKKGIRYIGNFYPNKILDIYQNFETNEFVELNKINLSNTIQMNKYLIGQKLDSLYYSTDQGENWIKDDVTLKNMSIFKLSKINNNDSILIYSRIKSDTIINNIFWKYKFSIFTFDINTKNSKVLYQYYSNDQYNKILSDYFLNFVYLTTDSLNKLIRISGKSNDTLELPFSFDIKDLSILSEKELLILISDTLIIYNTATKDLNVFPLFLNKDEFYDNGLTLKLKKINTNEFLILGLNRIIYLKYNSFSNIEEMNLDKTDIVNIETEFVKVYNTNGELIKEFKEYNFINILNELKSINADIPLIIYVKNKGTSFQVYKIILK